MAAAGVPLRCIARVVGSSDGVYIAGDSLELVRPGQSDGEKFKFSRIFEPYATDERDGESGAAARLSGQCWLSHKQGRPLCVWV